MEKAYKNKERSLDDVPVLKDYAEVYVKTTTDETGMGLFGLLDDLTEMQDQILADWLNITPRTIHNYRVKPTKLKANTKEHILLLLSLYKHGIETFSYKDRFENWLSSPNQFLDGRAPKDFLDTISGIHFIDDRLTAIDYGENA